MSLITLLILRVKVKFNSEQFFYAGILRRQDETWKKQILKRCFKNDYNKI